MLIQSKQWMYGYLCNTATECHTIMTHTCQKMMSYNVVVFVLFACFCFKSQIMTWNTSIGMKLSKLNLSL